MFTTAIDPEEILQEIAIEPSPPNTGWAFLEVARRSGDYAMAGVAAMVELGDDGRCAAARLVYLNVGDGPVESKAAVERIVGEKPDDSVFSEAARLAAEEELAPFGNLHASPEYQRHLARVLTQRALDVAAERAAA
jgi:aerobic carbon-monoxide dehydrogenase medium subunit